MTGKRTPGGALPPALEQRPTAGVVGRDAEIDALLAAARSVVRGEASCRTVLVTGEAGIGKTTMVAEVARRLHRDGSTVLYGRCLEDLRVPYLPVAEALDAFVGSAPTTAFDAIDEASLVELSRMVTGVGDRWPHLPRPRATDPDTERYLLFRAVTTILSDLALIGPVVLVVEDVHWADTSTVRLLRHLASTLSSVPVVSLVTGRDLDSLSGQAVDRELTELLADGLVERFHLEGFDDARMVSLLEHLAGHAMDTDGVTLARQLCSRTGGNPFFATAILQHLAETEVIRPEAGRWSSTVDVEQIALPATVRDVLERRLGALDRDLRSVLDLAAVFGREFDLLALSLLTGVSEDDLLDQLEEACELGLVDEDSSRLGRFAFAHALIQRTLYEAQSRTRRARRHRAIAELLETLDVPDDAERVAELAHHWALTGADGTHRALHHAVNAGRTALRALAPQDARQWCERAIELGRACGDDELELRLDAQIGLGSAQRQLGDAAYRDTLIRAALEADLVGDVDRLVGAVLANHRGLVSAIGEVDEERVALIERAAAAAGRDDPRSRARLLALLAGELTFGREHQRVRAAVEEAEAIARRLGDDETLLHVLNSVFLSMWVPSELDRTRSASIEALQLAERVRDPVQSFLATANHVYASTSLVDRPGIDQALADASAFATPIAQPHISWRLAYISCVPPLIDGDMERAEALAESALEVGVQSGQPDAFTLYGATLSQIRLHQDRLDEMVPLVAELARENPGLPGFSATHAMMLSECGRLDEARALLDRAAAASFHDDAYDYVWLTTTTIWADVAASTRHTAAAPALYERLAPYRTQGVSTGPTMSGVVDQYVARLAWLLGRHEEALDSFRAADDLLARLGATYFRARNQLFWAQALLERSDPGSVEQAHALIGSARTIGELHGCRAIVDHARAMV